MANYINGINPNIIKWARERSGYTLEEVAKFFKKDVATISDWEVGAKAPTYIQLEKLADKYKRPIAIFFFPEPPQEPDFVDQPALRSAAVEKLDPSIRVLLRQAYARQLSLMELNTDVNPAEQKIFRDLRAHLDDSPIELAQQTRVYLEGSVETQVGWSDPTNALENWRDRVEEKGVFVFKDAFRDDFVDGFCLVHEQFPVIYLNNTRPFVRQIFSLFHELAHLLLGENGITRGTNFEGGKIEVFCNQFAGEFLVPSSDLDTRPEKEAGGNPPSGGSYYNTRALYLGYRFMELAFSKYYQGHCSIEELAELMNVKVKNLPGLEDCLLRKATR